jgi:hypothetical protein
MVYIVLSLKRLTTAKSGSENVGVLTKKEMNRKRR